MAETDENAVAPLPQHFQSLKWRDDSGQDKVYRFRQTFSPQWKDLGKQFGFKNSQLTIFEKRKQGDPPLCLDEVLEYWLVNYSDPPEAYPVTWEGLVEALKDLDCVNREVKLLETALEKNTESIVYGAEESKPKSFSLPANSQARIPYLAPVLIAVLVALMLSFSFMYIMGSASQEAPKIGKVTTIYTANATLEEPEAPPPSSSGDDGRPISLTSKPTMVQLLSFHVYDGSVINIPEEIGTDYDDFGVFILNDETGGAVANIRSAQRGDPELINKEVLKRWLGGRGSVPVTWATLLQVLRLIQKNELANDIEKSIKQ